MKKIIRNSSLSFLILAMMFISFSLPAEAFSLNFNPGGFFQTTSLIIINEVSSLINYLTSQKNIFLGRLNRQNTSSSQNENISASATSTVPEMIGSALVDMANSILPKVKNIAPANPVQVPDNEVSTSSVSHNTTNYTADSTPVFTPSRDGSQGILSYTNIERVKDSLSPLLADGVLDGIASLRADDLFDNQYFEHVSPDGKSVSDLAKKLGYDYLLIGENLALGNFTGDAGIVSAWMGSPGHKANILNGKFTKLGVSVKTGVFKGENVTIAVQVFAEPMSVCPKPNDATKALIDSSSATIKQMQTQASSMLNNVNLLKSQLPANPDLYNQKVREYNSYAKKINYEVLALKNMIDFYNIQVGKYNSCINN